MFRNTYLEKMGELMQNCMELTKKVEDTLEELKKLALELRDANEIKNCLRNDAEDITSLFMNGAVSEEEARKGLKQLKVYVIKQLDHHYNTIPQLFKDMEKRFNELLQDIQEEISKTELPESLKDELKDMLDRVEEDIDMLAEEMRRF